MFIVCTQNVLTRALTGKLMAALEDRHLLPVHMKLLRPTQDVIDVVFYPFSFIPCPPLIFLLCRRFQKSHLLKEEKRRQLDDVWMILVFRGREAQTRVAECIKQFKTQYSLHKSEREK